MKRSLSRRLLATAVAVVYSTTQIVLGSFAESNLWTERKRNSNALQLASLPSTLHNDALPSIFELPSLTEKPLSTHFQRVVSAHAPALLLSAIRALPQNIGTVRKIMLPEHGSGKVVIHIQDVHRNFEAQKNIGSALQNLMSSKTVGLVALEGAFDPIDLDWYRAYPNKRVPTMVADWLLKENRISGPIYSALTYLGEIPRFVGVDDKIHYNANVNAYRHSVRFANQNRNQLDRITHDLNVEKEKTFGPLLKHFDAQVTAYHDGSMPWSSHVRFLTETARTFPNIPVSPKIAALLSALRLENELNFPVVERERTQMVSDLVKRMSKAETDGLLRITADYQMGTLSHSDFYAALQQLVQRKGLPLSRYPHMTRYIQYVLLSDGLDVDAMMSDIATLERQLYNTLTRTPQEKRLIEQSRWLALTKKLLDFSLTNEEWKEYRQVALTGGDLPLTTSLKTYRHFYEEAKARDAAMTINMLKYSHHTDISVLVTGGFHSTGIDQRLTDAGYIVVSYSPKISKIETENGAAYLSIFAQEKTPLDRLFAGEKLFLAAAPMTPVDPTRALYDASDHADRSPTQYGEAPFHENVVGVALRDGAIHDVSVRPPSSIAHHIWTLFYLPTLRETYIAERVALLEIPTLLAVTRLFGIAFGMVVAIAMITGHFFSAPHSRDDYLGGSDEWKGLYQNISFFILPVIIPGMLGLVVSGLLFVIKAVVDRKFFSGLRNMLLTIERLQRGEEIVPVETSVPEQQPREDQATAPDHPRPNEDPAVAPEKPTQKRVKKNKKHRKALTQEVDYEKQVRYVLKRLGSEDESVQAYALTFLSDRFLDHSPQSDAIIAAIYDRYPEINETDTWMAAPMSVLLKTEILNTLIYAPAPQPIVAKRLQDLLTIQAPTDERLVASIFPFIAESPSRSYYFDQVFDSLPQTILITSPWLQAFLVRFFVDNVRIKDDKDPLIDLAKFSSPTWKQTFTTLLEKSDPHLRAEVRPLIEFLTDPSPRTPYEISERADVLLARHFIHDTFQTFLTPEQMQQLNEEIKDSEQPREFFDRLLDHNKRAIFVSSQKMNPDAFMKDAIYLSQRATNPVTHVALEIPSDLKTDFDAFLKGKLSSMPLIAALANIFAFSEPDQQTTERILRLRHTLQMVKKAGIKFVLYGPRSDLGYELAFDDETENLVKALKPSGPAGHHERLPTILVYHNQILSDTYVTKQAVDSTERSLYLEVSSRLGDGVSMATVIEQDTEAWEALSIAKANNLADFVDKHVAPRSFALETEASVLASLFYDPNLQQTYGQGFDALIFRGANGDRGLDVSRHPNNTGPEHSPDPDPELVFAGSSDSFPMSFDANSFENNWLRSQNFLPLVLPSFLPTGASPSLVNGGNLAALILISIQMVFIYRSLLKQRPASQHASPIDRLAVEQRQTITALMTGIKTRDDEVSGLSFDLAQALQPREMTPEQIDRFHTALYLKVKSALMHRATSTAELVEKALNKFVRAPIVLFINSATTPAEIRSAFAEVRQENNKWRHRATAWITRRPSFICITVEPNAVANQHILNELQEIQNTYPDVLSEILYAGEGEFQERDFSKMFGLFAKSPKFSQHTGIVHLLEQLSNNENVGTRIIQINKPSESYTVDQVLLGLIVLLSDKILIDYQTVLLASKMA